MYEESPLQLPSDSYSASKSLYGLLDFLRMISGFFKRIRVSSGIKWFTLSTVLNLRAIL